MQQHSDRNVHITFIMLIIIRNIVKIKNYVRNESTRAQLEGKLLTRRPLVARETVKMQKREFREEPNC